MLSVIFADFLWGFKSLIFLDAELIQGRLTTDGHYLFALDSNVSIQNCGYVGIVLVIIETFCITCLLEVPRQGLLPQCHH